MPPKRSTKRQKPASESSEKKPVKRTRRSKATESEEEVEQPISLPTNDPNEENNEKVDEKVEQDVDEVDEPVNGDSNEVSENINHKDTTIVNEAKSEKSNIPHSQSEKQTTKEVSMNVAALGVPSQTIYLSNLNDQISIEVLRHTLYMLFSTFGHIVSIVTMKNKKMRGQAHVAFGSVLSASNAIRSMQGQYIFDKPAKIVFAKKKSDAIAKMDGTYRMNTSNGNTDTTTNSNEEIKYEDSDIEE